ncbi:MAG: 3-oxoacid CoA-transferase subunit B [Desulfonatronovibrionaceae bacterium]
MSLKHKIAARAAAEVNHGQTINLGIGLPTLIPLYLNPEIQVFIHSENGVLGAGRAASRQEAHPMLIDAGGGYITVRPGASFFDSAVSFSIVRGGRLDIAFLGALEVAENGDLANWIIPGKFAPGIGGGMELAQKARKLIVVTSHTTRKGDPKIIPSCTLPLTAAGCVDMIITELAVFQVSPKGLILRETAAGSGLEEVRARTGADFMVPEQGPGIF